MPVSLPGNLQANVNYVPGLGRIDLQHNMFKLTFSRTGLYRQQDTT